MKNIAIGFALIALTSLQAHAAVAIRCDGVAGSDESLQINPIVNTAEFDTYDYDTRESNYRIASATIRSLYAEDEDAVAVAGADLDKILAKGLSKPSVITLRMERVTYDGNRSIDVGIRAIAEVTGHADGSITAGLVNGGVPSHFPTCAIVPLRIIRN